MHHDIVIKVWAEDADCAMSMVSTAAEDSISPENNTEGWDFVSEITLITKDVLQSKYGVKTFSELEETLYKEREGLLQGFIEEIKQRLLPALAPRFLTKNEAPLYMNTDNKEFRVYIEKLFKRKGDIKKPETFGEIVDNFLNLLLRIAKDDLNDLLWKMEKIKKLQACINNNRDLQNTLQSADNNYAEIPFANKDGLAPYYFNCDRHL